MPDTHTRHLQDDSSAEPVNRSDPRWLPLQEQLKIDASNAKDAKVVIYGDSITEAWRGTQWGLPSPRTNGVYD